MHGVCLQAFASMLAAYRALQRRLSPAAVQAVRSLGTQVPSTISSSNNSREQHEAWLAEASARTGASARDLRELHELRRRLLYDVKYLKQRLDSSSAASGGGGGPSSLSSKLRARLSCNTWLPEEAPLEAAGGAAGQWVRAKQYQHRRSKAQQGAERGGVPGPQSGRRAGSAALDPAPSQAAASWISRLGFGDMVRDEAQEHAVGAQGEQLPAAEQLVADSAAGLLAPTTLLPPASSARAPAGAPGPSLQLIELLPPPAPPSPPPQQQQQQLAAGAHGVPQDSSPTQPALASASTSTLPSDLQGPLAAHPHASQPHRAAEPASLQQGDGATAHGQPALDPRAAGTPPQAPAEAADASAAVPAGAPSRLRSALLRAMRYKQHGGQGEAPVEPPEEQAATAPPPAFAGLDTSQVVMRAAFDVYAAPRRSRANPDEAALLVPP